MSIKRYMSKYIIRMTTALALVAVTSVIAVSLLMIDAGGATAFDADASGSAARHIQIPAQYTAQCSNSTAVPNPASNAGLVADCAALLASKDTLAGTTGNLNWSADLAISDWDGITTANNRVSKLGLSQKNLNGAIPSELGNLSNLRVLSLSYNATFDNDNLIWIGGLTGALPPELGNLSNLTGLYLTNNQLTGEIPSQLGNLSSLTYLVLRSNRLTGEIPSQLGNLSNLRSLDLSWNQLTGEIPSQLGNLSNLHELYLSWNQLTGEIPSQLGNLSNLRDLHLSDNQFTGCIPRSLRAPLGTQEIQYIGLPICAAATPTPTATSVPRATATPTPTATSVRRATATPTPTPTRAPGATPVATPIPTATSAASNDVMNRLTALESQVAEIPDLRRQVAEIPDLRRQVAEIPDLKNQVAVLATKVARLEGGSGQGAATATPTPTATPSPTPTSVAGTPGGNACITELSGSASVTGNWTPACLSTNPPNDKAYYARFYTFTLSDAAQVTITLSSNDATPFLYLLNGAGTDGSVRLFTGAAGTTAVSTTANLQPGAYTIESTTYYSETPGNFTLELEITR